MTELEKENPVDPKVAAYRQRRRFVFEQLFMCQFYPPEEVDGQLDNLVCNEDLMEELEENDLPAEDVAALKEKAARIMACREELDARIDEVATGWKTSRMGRTELSLLRQALYEMLYESDTVPYRVAINEAVEMAKIYGEKDAPGFVNGVLGRLVRSMGLAEDEP